MVEMELGTEQEFGLSQAAKEAQAAAHRMESMPTSFPPLFGNLCRRTARIDFVCSLTLAVAGVGVTAAAVWHAADQNPPAPVVASATRIVPPWAAPRVQSRHLVLRNPFDATEVFEFPAETTKSEAREAMAEVLLQRGRERARTVGIDHSRSRDPARGAPNQEPDALATTWSAQPAPAKRL